MSLGYLFGVWSLSQWVGSRVERTGCVVPGLPSPRIPVVASVFHPHVREANPSDNPMHKIRLVHRPQDENIIVPSHLPFYTLPAFPIWIISPVTRSSLLNTGQLVASAFASVSSTFVPMTLKVLFSGSMPAYVGTCCLYRLLSAVFRSRSTVVADENAIFDASLSIFFKKIDAMTVE